MRNRELVNDNLTAELEYAKAHHNIISMTIDGKMYGPAVRKAAYHCLSNQVPDETTCHVIRSVVKEISATTIDCLPNPTTVSQFAYELGVISDVQVGEVLVKHSNVTLATPLDAQHVNEVHVTVPTVPPTGYVLQ